MSSSRSSIQPSASGGLAGKAVMAVCLLASASAAAYFAYDARAARAAQAAARKAEPTLAADEDGEKPAPGGGGAGGGDLARLQLENRELKRRLAQMMSQAETGGAAPAAERPRGGRGRWIDELKEKDPERYKKIMERREERRNNREVAAQDQLSRIEERLEANRAATEAAGGQESPQTQKQNELLNQIASTMQELSGLREKWREVNQLPDGERYDKAQELFQKSADLRGKLAELQQQDRDLQLRDLGSKLGLSEDQTDTLSKSVGQIVKDTSPPRGPGRGGAGGGRAGGGARAR